MHVGAHNCVLSDGTHSIGAVLEATAIESFERSMEGTLEPLERLEGALIYPIQYEIVLNMSKRQFCMKLADFRWAGAENMERLGLPRFVMEDAEVVGLFDRTVSKLLREKGVAQQREASKQPIPVQQLHGQFLPTAESAARALPFGCAAFPVEESEPHLIISRFLRIPPDQDALLQAQLHDAQGSQEVASESGWDEQRSAESLTRGSGEDSLAASASSGMGAYPYAPVHENGEPKYATVRDANPSEDPSTHSSPQSPLFDKRVAPAAVSEDPCTRSVQAGHSLEPYSQMPFSGVCGFSQAPSCSPEPNISEVPGFSQESSFSHAPDFLQAPGLIQAPGFSHNFPQAPLSQIAMSQALAETPLQPSLSVQREFSHCLASEDASNQMMFTQMVNGTTPNHGIEKREETSRQFMRENVDSCRVVECVGSESSDRPLLSQLPYTQHRLPDAVDELDVEQGVTKQPQQPRPWESAYTAIEPENPSSTEGEQATPWEVVETREEDAMGTSAVRGDPLDLAGFDPLVIVREVFGCF